MKILGKNYPPIYPNWADIDENITITLTIKELCNIRNIILRNWAAAFVDGEDMQSILMNKIDESLLNKKKNIKKSED